MTAALAQTALDFCRECEGYPNAKIYPNGDVERSFTPPRGFNDFNYRDLNAVMAAVRSWMPGKAESVSLHCFDGQLFVAVVISDLSLEVRSEPLADPCQALMAACVAASRKLRAEA